MNIDYIDIAKHLGKDKLCTTYLEHISSYKSGWDKYQLSGVNSLDVWHHVGMNDMKLKASLPYFWAGHNLFGNTSEFIEAGQYCSEMLNINLFDAEVKKFEFCSVLETDEDIKNILNHHHSYRSIPLTRFKSGLGYDSTNFKHKIYNAGQNIKNKVTGEIRERLFANGYDPNKNYLKVENHYKKPMKHLNKGIILMEDLTKMEFLQECKSDLIKTYGNIKKTGYVHIPLNKSDINAATLPLMALMEKAQQYAYDPEQSILNLIKSIPDEVMNQYDKKARIRQIRANLKKLRKAGSSRYDLTEAMLKQAIM
jgi:hypothetical protein